MENLEPNRRGVLMEVRSFEDLKVWQVSMALAVTLHRQVEHCRQPGLRDQILRSSVSIPSNIAEGFERQTNKEFIRCLYIAKGSCGELRTQLYICKELDLFRDGLVQEFIDQTREISAMLVGLIRTRYERL